MAKKPDIRAVVDTQVFVRALAGMEPEARFYMTAIRICWKVVVSDEIIEEYGRVINKYGFRADVVIHELNKLYAMNKYRWSGAISETVSQDLAPRKDRHIVAPCVEGRANLIVTEDGGILDKRGHIFLITHAEVVTLREAQARLDAFETKP